MLDTLTDCQSDTFELDTLDSQPAAGWTPAGNTADRLAAARSLQHCSPTPAAEWLQTICLANTFQQSAACGGHICTCESAVQLVLPLELEVRRWQAGGGHEAVEGNASTPPDTDKL